jgi:hypothetical protein
LSPLGMPPAGWPHAGGSLFALYFSKDPTNLSRCAPFKPHLTLTVTFYCLHVFTLVYCCGHVGYMTIMGPSPMATGSGVHPIRIGCSPDPVGHKKTGWGKADCSTPGDPRRQPHSPPGASPPDPHSGMERAFGPLLSVWGCRHPQACFRGSAPSRLGEKLRPGQLSPRLCAIVSLAKHSLRSVTPCQYWHALGANIGTRPFPACQYWHLGHHASERYAPAPPCRTPDLRQE